MLLSFSAFSQGTSKVKPCSKCAFDTLGKNKIDTPRKIVDPDPIIILQIRKSNVPALLDVINNSTSNHLFVKEFYSSIFIQYQNQIQTDTTKTKK